MIQQLDFTVYWCALKTVTQTMFTLYYCVLQLTAHTMFSQCISVFLSQLLRPCFHKPWKRSIRAAMRGRQSSKSHRVTPLWCSGKYSFNLISPAYLCHYDDHTHTNSVWLYLPQIRCFQFFSDPNVSHF